MRRAKIILILALICLQAKADEVSDVIIDPITDVDETLFRASIQSAGDEAYNEATKYYRSPVSQRRRGVDWWLSNEILQPKSEAKEDYEAMIDMSRIRMFGSTRGYTAGGNLILSTVTNRGWSLAADIDMRTGRDANISGVFSQDFRGDFHIGKLFDRDHYITIDLTTPIMMEGLQGGASHKAITLTGDNLYNPAWGFYDGEVRNSRVRRYRVPQLNIRYQRPIAGSTIGAIELNAKSGRSSVSRLGWYDGYNPTPDYYRKLPSYISNSETKAAVEQLWRDQNSDYTQIAWDDLVEANQRSTDGEAHYIIEDQVKQVANADAKLLFRSEIGDGIRMSYGAKIDIDKSRYFKEMNDLLGADHLTDIDQYVGDYAHLSNDMQNNLRDPNRKVVNGDKFGYDYTLSGINTLGIVSLEYRSNAISVELYGEFGEQRVERIGHFEKERFAGELSYGKSKSVTLPASSAKIDLDYAPNARHSISLSASTHRIAPQSKDLFIQEQNANRTIDNATSQSVSSAELKYNYASPDFTLNINGYFIRSRDQINTWQSYDDITYTYSDVVVSGIGSTSFGVEAVGYYELSKTFRIDMTIAAGDYTYDTAPTISLYDDTDMTLYSTSEADAVVGCKVGNAPQLLTTFGMTLFGKSSFIFSADCSYAGGRYIAPSFMRRSDRVIRATGSPEMESAIVAQSNLGSVVDVAAAVTKTFWLADDNRISLTLRVNNLLGDRDRIDYARESNRILRNSASSDTGAYYLQPNIYYYDTPRSYYISCNYLF